MELEPVSVSARWNLEGAFQPIQFQWRDQLYRVESTGRSWEDETGLHVLCMAQAQVYELIFRLQPAGWWLRPPANRRAVA